MLVVTITHSHPSPTRHSLRLGNHTSLGLITSTLDGCTDFSSLTRDTRSDVCDTLHNISPGAGQPVRTFLEGKLPEVNFPSRVALHTLGHESQALNTPKMARKVRYNEGVKTDTLGDSRWCDGA